MFARARPEGDKSERKAAGPQRSGSQGRPQKQPQPGPYWSAFVFAPSTAPGRPVVQRMCAACEEGEEESRVARMPAGSVEVGRADDPLEHEAERVAKEVVGDHGTASSTFAPAAPSPAPPRIQPSRAGASAGPHASVASQVGSQGQPLSSEVRDYFEPRFGRSFEHVRLHTGAAAAAAAESVDARAFTLGRDIVLGEGAAPASTREGRRLLAHELTHVVQQESHPSAPLLIRRQPRELPTASATSSFLFYPSLGQPDVRVDFLAHKEGGLRSDSQLRPRLSAIMGPGATIRGVARALLPLYQRATPPQATQGQAALSAQVTTPPTEDEIAKAILDYNRYYLPVPSLTDFHVGMRLPLPVEIALDVGPKSGARGDFVVNFATVKIWAANVSAADAALVDSAPQAAAAAPTAQSPEVTQFITAKTSALARGIGLSASLLRNPIEGGPFTTAVLGALSGQDQFDAALELANDLVGHQVSLLVSVKPGLEALRGVRAILAAPPSTLSGSREEARKRGLRGLPQDPTITGLAPEFLVDEVYRSGKDDIMTLYFERGRSSVPATEYVKLYAIAKAEPTGLLTLTGSRSEDEPASVALDRAKLIESVLQTLRPNGTLSTAQQAGLGSVSYAAVRNVQVTKGTPTPPPNCGVGVSDTDPCDPSWKMEDKFKKAQPRASTIVSDALTKIQAGTADPLLARFFGKGVARSTVESKVVKLQKTVGDLVSSHLCGNICNGTCAVSGAYAPNKQPPLMVLCEDFGNYEDEMAASVLIHESCHATKTIGAVKGRGPVDWAYRWERMAGVITEVTPNRALDNADNIALFLMELRTPIANQPFTPDKPPTDQFGGTWKSADETKVKHALAFAQKWLIWGGQYVAKSYGRLTSGKGPDETYGFAAKRFGLTAATGTPGDKDRAMLAGILDRIERLGDRVKEAISITQAASGQPTTFTPGAPMALEVGTDILGIKDDTKRGRALLTKLFEADPDVPAAQRSLYSDLCFDIQKQYILDRS